jgi:YHS domain-containing protein
VEYKNGFRWGFSVVRCFFVGCNKSDTATTSSPRKTADAHGDDADHDHGDHDHDAAGDATNQEITAALSELSPEDRALAEKQRICPVTGELLGSMGAPMKVDVKGQTVFICCEGCKEELLAKPDEYLAKLNQ